MKKLGKLLVVSVLGLTMFLQTTNVSQASCSNWTIVGNEGSWYCENQDGCGPLWLKGTNTIRTKWERTCDKNGKQVKEYKYGPTKNGCC